jgi:hypothetical protein
MLPGSITRSDRNAFNGSKLSDRKSTSLLHGDLIAGDPGRQLRAACAVRRRTCIFAVANCKNVLRDPQVECVAPSMREKKQVTQKKRWAASIQSEIVGF